MPEKQLFYIKLINSPAGKLLLGANSEGLSLLHFFNNHSEQYLQNFLLKNNFCSSEKSHPVIRDTENWLKDYFKGQFKPVDILLNPSGTEFQKKIWNLLHKIPPGETRTYLQQAKQYGDVLAIRAVASANGANPVAIIIPCHRVIGSDGSLTGFSGGLHVKKYLLQHERKYFPLPQQLL